MSEKQTEEALPMFNRDEIATEAGFFDVMFRLHDIKRECVMPARVISYDRENHLASVQPLVQKFKETSQGKSFWNRDTYENIPVLFSRHGGFVIDFPIDVGETGYLIATDRPNTLARLKNSDWDASKNKGPQPPDDESLSSFEHGLFVPCSFQNFPLSDENKTNLIIKHFAWNGDSWCDEIMERMGDIHLRSTRHPVIVDGVETLVGGHIRLHLDYKITDASGRETYGLGDLNLIGNLDTEGNVIARKWDAPDGSRIGGAVASTNGERTATMSADDLDESDAKFREVTVVTGFKEKVGKIVRLFAKKFRVLADEQIDGEDVEFEVGGGGGAKLKLKYGDNAPVVYDGEEEKEFFVPTPPEPIVPNNGTLSMKVNGVEQATFTANQNTNSEFNVVIPTPPEPIVPGDGKLTITVNGSVKTFTANQAADTSVDITTGLAISGSAPTSIGDNVIIVAMRYDYAGSHQIQVKVRGMVFANDRIVGVTPVSEWLMIDGGQCVEHQQGK